MPRPLIEIPGDIDQNWGYRVGKWREYPNYECIYCQYATLFLARMEKHQAEGQHPWAYPSETDSTEAVEGGPPVAVD